MTIRNWAIGIATLAGMALLAGCSSSESDAGAAGVEAGVGAGAPGSTPASEGDPYVATQWGPVDDSDPSRIEPGDVINFTDWGSPMLGGPVPLSLDLSVSRTEQGSDRGWVLKYSDAKDEPNGIGVEEVVWYEHTYQDNGTKYVAFGTWINSIGTGVPQLYTFNLIDQKTSSGDISGESGTATFEGRSLGFYQDTNISDKIYRTSGDVRLTANFDTYRIEGVLDNFRVDGRKSVEDWVLNLGSTDIVHNRGDNLDGLFGAHDALSGTVEGGYSGRIVDIQVPGGPTDDANGALGDYDGSKDGMRLVGVFGGM